METYKLASEVLGPKESAVALFAHGKKLVVDPKGKGHIGNWAVDPDTLSEIDQIILYVRKDGEAVNRIFIGDFLGVSKSEQPHRLVIHFAGLKEVGTTAESWLNFSGGGQNPICYLQR